MLVADTGNHCVRRVVLDAAGVILTIETIAGIPMMPGGADEVAARDGTMHESMAMAVGPAGHEAAAHLEHRRQSQHRCSCPDEGPAAAARHLPQPGALRQRILPAHQPAQGYCDAAAHALLSFSDVRFFSSHIHFVQPS